jgi:phosphatidylserine decarboxylase
MLVSSVETVWSGLEIPPYASSVTRKDWRERAIRLERGAEMGRFNMGSTVIFALPAGRATWDDRFAAETLVHVGSRIGGPVR